MEQNIRRKGFIKFIIGVGGAVLLGFFIAWIRKIGYELTSWGLILFGIPGAFGVLGLLELISGVPFLQLSNKWDELKGWQRGMLGIVVVILCLGLLFGGLALYGYMTM